MVEMPNLADLNIDDFSISVDDVRALARNLEYLAVYAGNKANAMASRNSGQTAQAKRFESTCEEIYKKLPSNWRW